jgi:hypothetical protein
MLDVFFQDLSVGLGLSVPPTYRLSPLRLLVYPGSLFRRLLLVVLARFRRTGIALEGLFKV